MVYKIIESNELYHYGVKGMKWGVKKNRRLANRAKKQANSMRSTAKELIQRGHDYDDLELWELASPSEKRRSRQNAKRLAANDFKAADFWDKAAKDIASTNSYRDGKKKFKQYRLEAIKTYGYVFNP